MEICMMARYMFILSNILSEPVMAIFRLSPYSCSIYLRPVMSLVTVLAIGMVVIQCSLIFLSMWLLHNIMQVTCPQVDFVLVAMLTICHFASDFGHIPHAILFK
jgi:hypothetical protein